MKNWKTTVSALLAALPQILHYFFPTYVTTDVANALSGLFVSLGLVAAADGKKSVNPQTPNDETK